MKFKRSRLDEGWFWPEGKRYVNDIGEIEPSCFSEILAKQLPVQAGMTRLLDLGCGNGIVGLYALIERRIQYVTFNELLPRRLAVAAANVNWNAKKGRLRGDQFDFVTGSFRELPHELVAKHDLMAFNMPLFPEHILNATELAHFTRDRELNSFRGNNSDGLAMVREFVAWFGKLPTGRPDAIINVPTFLGLSRIEKALECCATEIIARTRVPLRARFETAANAMSKAECADQALVSDSRGHWTEEILTIRVRGASSSPAQGSD